MTQIPDLLTDEYYVSPGPDAPAFPAQIQLDADRDRPWFPRFRPSVGRAVWRLCGNGSSPHVGPDGMMDGRDAVPWQASWRWMFAPPPMPSTLVRADLAVLADHTRLHAHPGEQAVTIELPGAPHFPATVGDAYWTNPVPAFRRTVAEVVLAWINTDYLADPDPYGQPCGYWSGDRIVLFELEHLDDPDYFPVVIAPHEERWAIGARDWMWELAPAR